MKRQQQLFSNYIDTICGKFNCLEAASPLKEGFLALCEAGEQPAAGMKIEPGWPEKDSNFDYASAFDKCPYAADFINMLKEELEKLGTINFGEPVVIDDRGPVDNLRMGGLHLSMNRYNGSRPFPFLYLYAPMTGRGKPMPISSKDIGEIHNPGNNFEISSKIIWVPNGYFKGDDVPANTRIQITPENMGDVVKQIVDRVKWFTDNYLDLDACNMMLNVHRKWLSRRARNVADTTIGKKFVEKFNEMAENTPLVTGKNFWNEPYERHAVGIEKGRDLNRVGINKLDIYTMHGGEINMRDPYTLRCTSDGSVVLVGHSESLDYGSILLTEDNWAEVCNDVFNEVCEIEKEGAAAAEEKKAREQAREAGRVMCNRQKIKDKFGEFLYKKFFDVINDGELNGKTTDEIIIDLKCAIAEDRAEYDLMAKQDAIRAGKE